MSPTLMLLDDLATTWSNSIVTRFVVLGVGLWLTHQLWSFIPAADAQSDEPPYLPYTIPWVGHTLAFARDSSKVFNAALQRFGLQPFTLKIAGQKHYVFTHPQHVLSVFKASRSLTFDSSTADVLKLIYGMSDDPTISVEELLHGGKELPDGSIMEDPHTWFRRELSGTAAEVMTEGAIAHIEHKLSEEFAIVSEHGSAGVEVGFLLWARNLLSDAVTKATFGPRFLKRFPRTIDALWEMDDSMYKLMYGVPRAFAKQVYDSREEIVDSLKIYLDDTEEGKTLREGAMNIVVGREEVMKAAGVSLDGRARGILTILQAFHTNSAPTSFWFILYSVLTPGLYERIMEEISPAWSVDPSSSEPKLDLSYLTSTKTCPLFHSVYTETLRLVSSTISVRMVDEKTANIGGYTVYEGAKVFCPARPLQLSSEFWGTDANRFIPDRFVARPQDGAGLKMRPFGGGPTLCPGRFFAAAEVKAFVAGALMRFDFSFQDGMPEPDVKTPCLGVMRSVGVCKGTVRPRDEWIRLLSSCKSQ